MSTRDVSTNKDRRLTCLFVALVTTFIASVIVFVGCKERFIFVVPGIVFIMFTVAVIGVFGQVCCELISRTWPKRVGFIRHARIVRSYLPAGGMHSGNSSPSHAYSLDVNYDYAVGGKWYNATRVSFVKKDYSTRKEAEMARHLLLQDRTINVFYCPLIPSLSCIAHVKTRDMVITLSVVVAICVMSLIFTLIAFYYLP